MENKVLQTLGDLQYIQEKHLLMSKTGFDNMNFVERLLSLGSVEFLYMPIDIRNSDRYKLLARDCTAIGLEVEEGPGWMKDDSWRHSGSNDDIPCLKLTIKLPTSPAIKILYGAK